MKAENTIVVANIKTIFQHPHHKKYLRKNEFLSRIIYKKREIGMYILLERIKALILDSPYDNFENYMWKFLPSKMKNKLMRHIIRKKFEEHLLTDLFKNKPIKKIE